MSGGMAAFVPLALAAGIVGPRDADRIRIQRHLAQVEAELRAADVDGMDPALREARARHLDELHRYATRGTFPRNRAYAERVPIFIDDEGTACAVGHLMIASGARATAEAIARTQNAARVPAIDDASAAEWIATSGLSVAEHTRIQPNYCPCDDTVMPVCGTDGITYANACTATDCAGVGVAHEGICDANTEGNATDWPAPGTSTGSSSDTTGATTGTATTGTTSGGSTGPASTATDGGVDDRTTPSSGCRVTSSPTAAWALVLLVFGRPRRRR